MVEPQPSKLMTRVRFPLAAPEVVLHMIERGPCSSVVEHSLGKGEVGSSILPMGTSFLGLLCKSGAPECLVFFVLVIFSFDSLILTVKRGRYV
jgi:hypothetical protein